VNRVPTMVLAGVLTLTCRATSADPIVVDQSFLPARLNLLAWVRDDVVAAQTFTVGVSGNLTRVELVLTNDFGFGTAMLDLRPTLGGVPVEDGALALAHAPLSATTTDPKTPTALVAADLSAFIIPVVRGDVLALVLQGPNANWWGQTNATYGRGELYTRSPSLGMATFTKPVGNSPSELPYDLAFRTWVDPAPIPEPGTLLLVGAGVACLAVRMRRPRKVGTGHRNTQQSLAVVERNGAVVTTPHSSPWSAR
jgi:PEP-CTERM motif